MFGNRVDTSEWTPFRSVVGEIIRSPKGNIVLRIGREHENGWSPTEHVVMTPNETVYFVNEVTQVLNPRSTKDQLTLKLSRELAQELLDKMVNDPLNESSERFAQLWERIAAFVAS